MKISRTSCPYTAGRHPYWFVCFFFFFFCGAAHTKRGKESCGKNRIYQRSWKWNAFMPVMEATVFSFLFDSTGRLSTSFCFPFSSSFSPPLVLLSLRVSAVYASTKAISTERSRGTSSRTNRFVPQKDFFFFFFSEANGCRSTERTARRSLQKRASCRLLFLHSSRVRAIVAAAAALQLNRMASLAGCVNIHNGQILKLTCTLKKKKVEATIILHLGVWY